ncbi:MAG: hypothetical protein IT304_06515 [Dehalococcoidia bacterium]|nr:hypothetical protein [Dehalococcoidia bacterium]
MAKRARFFLASCIAAIAVLAACGDDAAAPTTAARPAADPSREAAAVQAAFGDVRELPGVAFLEPHASLAALVADADLIALVTPVRAVGEYWPADGMGVLAATRFELRVDRVLKGAAQGPTIVAHAPGGTYSLSFPANGPQRGAVGQAGERRMDLARPFYRPGVQELVFLSRLQEPDLGTYYFDLGPEARYRVENGHLAPADPRLGADAAALAPGDWRAALVGKTPAEAEARVRAALR